MNFPPAALSRHPFERSYGNAPGIQKLLVGLLSVALCFSLVACSHKPDPKTLVMIIESSPSNLDPRLGLDAQSERIDGLLFDNLVARNEQLSVSPELAERW